MTQAMTQAPSLRALALSKLLKDLVDLVGIEPTTSSMPWKRAPSCATGPLGWGSQSDPTSQQQARLGPRLRPFHAHLARWVKSNVSRVGRLGCFLERIVVDQRFGVVGTVGAIHPAAVAQGQQKARGEDLSALLVQRVIDPCDWLSDHMAPKNAA